MTSPTQDVPRRSIYEVAGDGSHPDFDDAGVAVFAAALERAGITDHDARAQILDYWAWMTRGPMAAHPDSPDQVDPSAPLHTWTSCGPTDR